MIEEYKKSNLFDLASLITIIGILLYSLGWIYYSTFFGQFNIDHSFIEISYSKIISTTWPFVVIIGGGFFLSIQHIYETPKDKFYIIPAVYVIVVSIFMLIGLVTKFSSIVVMSYLLFLIIYIGISFYIKRKRIELAIISKKHFIYTLMLIIYICAIIFYFYLAQNKADRIRNSDKHDIVLNLKNAGTVKGNLVSYMNDKYFLLVNIKGTKNLVIINNDDVSYAGIIKHK